MLIENKVPRADARDQLRVSRNSGALVLLRVLPLLLRLSWAILRSKATADHDGARWLCACGGARACERGERPGAV